MPERALYDLIRERYDASFAKLLETIRIHRACELMQGTDLPVKEITRLVGYASDHTFRIAFKRVMGVTPGEYGKSAQVSP